MPGVCPVTLMILIYAKKVPEPINILSAASAGLALYPFPR